VLTLALEYWEELQSFFESGGDVLLAIFAVTMLLWTLILERLYYLRFVFPKELQLVAKDWSQRQDRGSWAARQIRRQKLSEMGLRISRSLPMVKTLVALCPLLGLLGTVTGMIQVFDVMALSGSGNARGMASGVSMATIPTMAGMVAALSGVYFSARLDRRAYTNKLKVEALLDLDRGEK
jgi:biopolymer transport protein ExbB